MSPRKGKDPEYKRFNKIFASVIKAARKQRGITQTEMADRMGMTSGGWSKIENGFNSPKAAKIQRIATALNMDPAFLFVASGEVRAALDDPELQEIREEMLALSKAPGDVKRLRALLEEHTRDSVVAQVINPMFDQMNK